jgi:hypothetical protein
MEMRREYTLAPRIYRRTRIRTRSRIRIRIRSPKRRPSRHTTSHIPCPYARAKSYKSSMHIHSRRYKYASPTTALAPRSVIRRTRTTFLHSTRPAWILPLQFSCVYGRHGRACTACPPHSRTYLSSGAHARSTPDLFVCFFLFFQVSAGSE